jgi:hypothetical protein
VSCVLAENSVPVGTGPDADKPYLAGTCFSCDWHSTGVQGRGSSNRHVRRGFPPIYEALCLVQLVLPWFEFGRHGGLTGGLNFRRASSVRVHVPPKLKATGLSARSINTRRSQAPMGGSTSEFTMVLEVRDRRSRSGFEELENSMNTTISSS